MCIAQALIWYQIARTTLPWGADLKMSGHQNKRLLVTFCLVFEMENIDGSSQSRSRPRTNPGRILLQKRPDLD